MQQLVEKKNITYPQDGFDLYRRRNRIMGWWSWGILAAVFVVSCVLIYLYQREAYRKVNGESQTTDAMTRQDGLAVTETGAAVAGGNMRYLSNEAPKQEEVQRGSEQVVDAEAKKAHERRRKIMLENGLQQRMQHIYKPDGRKIAYLTFDDGPTENITPRVLKILKENDVRATFFVLGKLAEAHPEILRQVAEAGHEIGNHSYSHDYRKVYASNELFAEEVEKTDTAIKKALGSQFETYLFRFPGGSFEQSKEPFKQVLDEYGYGFVDWNCLNGDGEGQHITAGKLVKRFKETAAGKEHVVALMHDSATKGTTVDALPEIISYLKNEGYAFETLQ